LSNGSFNAGWSSGILRLNRFYPARTIYQQRKPSPKNSCGLPRLIPTATSILEVPQVAHLHPANESQYTGSNHAQLYTCPPDRSCPIVITPNSRSEIVILLAAAQHASASKRIAEFWIDGHDVTNATFAKFVASAIPRGCPVQTCPRGHNGASYASKSRSNGECRLMISSSLLR
jgi:hypothetical protein